MTPLERSCKPVLHQTVSRGPRKVTTADCIVKERAARRNAQEFQQEKQREMNQDIMELFWQQKQKLQILVDLQFQ